MLSPSRDFTSAEIDAAIERSRSIFPSQSATERCRYVRPDGKIRFRAVLAQARRQRALNDECRVRFAALFADWDRTSRLDRVRFIMSPTRAIVNAELGLFSPSHWYVKTAGETLRRVDDASFGEAA